MTGLTRQQVREIDRRAVEEYGLPIIVLMENAGRAAAEVLMRLNPQRDSVTLMCGRGNNGGDGLVMARHLEAAGWPITVYLFADPAELTPDVAANYHAINRSSGRVFGRPSATIHLVEKLSGWPDGVCNWTVDALFGTGLSRPAEPPIQGIIETLMSSPSRVLSIDVPSGLDCDTGKPLGACVRATHTVTFVAPKLGFANPAAKPYLGTVHVAPIGVPRRLLAEYGV